MKSRLGQRMVLVVAGSLAGVVVLLGCELILRVLDWPPVHRRPPRFQQMSFTARAFTAFEQPDDTTLMRWSLLSESETRQRGREFRDPKAPGAYRIFVVGESSAEGVPYGVNFAFSSWLADRLRTNAGGRTWEVVNAARGGTTMNRVLVTVDEIVRHAPDLVIVYAGHNEGIEWAAFEHMMRMNPWRIRVENALRATRLFATVDAYFGRVSDAPIPAPEPASPEGAQEYAKWRQDPSFPFDRERRLIAERHRRNLERLVEQVRNAGGEVILMSLASDFVGWPPRRSIHTVSLRPDRLREWEEHFAEARRLEAEGELDQAIESYEQAMEIDASFAELAYRHAGCLRKLGRTADAREQYLLARDLDVGFVGAPRVLNEAIREVARDLEVPFVDVKAVFESVSSGGIIGPELMADPMHPSLKGHEIIAREVEREMRRRNLGAPPAWEDRFPEGLSKSFMDQVPGLAAIELVNRLFFKVFSGIPTDCGDADVLRLRSMVREAPKLTKSLADTISVETSKNFAGVLDRVDSWCGSLPKPSEHGE